MCRKLTVFVAFCLVFSNASFSQPEWLNPKPSGYWCTKVIFTDALNGFVFNGNGDLLKTTDQGDHWNLQQNFPFAVTMDLKDSTGVICGSVGTVYISRNNGKDWAKTNPGYSEDFSMADIVSRDTIFLASATGKIIRSDDGGNTWKYFNCGIQISSIEFINSKLGYAGGKSTYILKTQDGGSTWQQNIVVNHIPSYTTVIKFIDSTHGFAFREHSDMLSTTDGGATWKTTNVGDYIYSLFFLNKTTGFACGEYGVTYRTNDAGTTWNPLGFTSRIWLYDLSSIYFLNSDTGFAVGARGRILKTTDGCKTWKNYAVTYNDIGDISVADNNTFYAISGSYLYKSTNQGQLWKEVPVNLNPVWWERGGYVKCHFKNADTGLLLATDYPRIYRTVNGGKSWDTTNTVSERIYSYGLDMQFLDDNTGYAIYAELSTAGSAAIFKTKDCGFTWTTVWSARFTSEFFSKIFFVNEKTGYASRYQYLYKTDDSAKTWTQLWNVDYKFITAINFPSAKVGYVVGESGLMKKTVDSGKTWTSMTIPSFYSDAYNVKFTDEKTGYLSAEYGPVYKTIDGGTNWSFLARSPNEIRTIKFGKDSSVFFGGANGTILKSFVPEYRIDSFSLKSRNTCSTDFYALVTAAYSTVDSIRLQYGTTAFDHELVATPSTISNNQIPVTVSITDLPPSTQYKARLKIYYKGQYYYSNEYNFITLNKPATPTVSAGNTTICAGDSVLLSSSASGNQWLFNNAAIAGAVNSSYAAKQTGSYGVFTKNGCYHSDTASIAVVVNPIPAKPTISSSGTVLTSSASSGNQWFLNGNPISNANGASYTPANSGLYAVRVTLNNCTSEMSEGVNFIITAVGNINFDASIIIAPNPVSDRLTIHCKNSNASLVVSLIDLSGKYLIEKARFTSDYTMDMGRLQAGMYIVEVRNSRTGEITRRLVTKL